MFCAKWSVYASTVTFDPVADSDLVTVPRSEFIPCRQLQRLLHNYIDPAVQSPNVGCDIYYRAVSLVGHHVADGCVFCDVTL